MEFTTRSELSAYVDRFVRITNGTMEITDAAGLRGDAIDRLAFTAVFAADEGVRDAARDAIQRIARAAGATTASILPLYDARSRGEVSGFTVPAINVRLSAYEMSRAIFRAMKRTNAGVVVFELARSEMGYTFQRPAEFAAVVLAAGVKEGYVGPVFIQGDHYQANAKKFAVDPEAEEAGLRDLITEAIAAGYGNIDIDSSTLVDLSQPTVETQQRVNGEVCARLTAHVRKHERPEMPVSIGGEIGEVGLKNSTVEELRAFMSEYRRALDAIAPGAKGISKMSVQTGTSHGGIPLPDGSVATVKLDFDVLRDISKVARSEFGMAGAVQHGASTLPDELFDKFPQVETAEIHLATGFQNLVMDHPRFPAELKRAMYAWCDENCAGERKSGETDEQFHYKTRKKVWGPFKRESWTLPRDVNDAIMHTLEEQFVFLFGKLRATDTTDLVKRCLPAGEHSAAR